MTRQQLDITDNLSCATGRCPCRRRRRCAGFTLIEAIISIVLVGALLVAVMNTVGASKTVEYTTLERSEGNLLAQSMMAEILNRSYEEPDDTPVFGRETAEIVAQRDQWDDVDDYNGWSATPPERPDGTAIASSEWTRSVAVVRVNPDDLSQTSGSETGAKKVTVTIKRGGRVLATRTAVRTSAR